MGFYTKKYMSTSLNAPNSVKIANADSLNAKFSFALFYDKNMFDL